MSRRARWHRQIGTRLEAGYGVRARELAVELAMHFARGRDMVRAVRYLHSAGEQALQRSAHQEAIAHFTHALTLLPILPETPERTEQELQVHMALGPALIATKGYADPDVGHTYSRARELCQQVGETPHLFPVLFGLWLFHLVRGELQTARHEAEEFLRLVNRQQAPALFLEAHGILGITLIYLGECAMARRHLEQSLALYDPTQHRSLAFLYGQDHGVVCLSYAAWVLWLLGYPDQALQRSQEALSLAQELSHPFSRAFALNFAALLRLHRREGQAAQAQAETLIALSVEQGFALYCAHGTILRGGALAVQGQGEAGMAQMLQGLEALQATGAVLRRPYYLAVLAEVYGRQQQAKEGLTLLTAALEIVHKSAERIHEAELYRLKGELLLQQWQGSGSTVPVASPQSLTLSPQVEAEAEACFLKALEVARRQQAKSWELRAAISLSRLWQQQGKRAEARELLAPIYTGSPRGLTRLDLQEAKALLNGVRKGVNQSRHACARYGSLTTHDHELPRDLIPVASAIGCNGGEIFSMGFCARRGIEPRIGQGHWPTGKGCTACLLRGGIGEERRETVADNLLKSRCGKRLREHIVRAEVKEQGADLGRHTRVYNGKNICPPTAIASSPDRGHRPSARLQHPMHFL